MRNNIIRPKKEQVDVNTSNLILETAIKVFAKKGFHSASLRDIGHECNVHPSMIIYYFDSKDGLLMAVLKRAKIQLDACTNLLANISSLGDKLMFLIDATTNWLIDYENIARVVFYEMSLHRNEPQRPEINDIFNTHRSLFFQTLDNSELITETQDRIGFETLYHFVFGTIASVWINNRLEVDKKKKLKETVVFLKMLINIPK